MKSDKITVVYHSGDEVISELMTKLIKIKLTSEDRLRNNYKETHLQNNENSSRWE